MKTTTRKLLLVLSGALILTLGIRFFLSGGSKSPPPPPAVQVLVAARDLPAGLLLNAGAWTWRAMPQSDVPKGAIVQGGAALSTLKGSLLHNPVKLGMPLRSTDIISSADPGFLAASLRPGMRAVSVAVNDVSSNAGLIQPGDYVDLILTQSLRDSQNAARSVVSETIGRGLRVIAVGSTLLRPKDKDNESASGGGSVRTVTLEVWPRGAAAIAVAAKLGDISLALRSFATTGRDAAKRDQVRMPSVLPGVSSDEDNDDPVWAGDISSAARADTGRPNTTGMTATTQNGVLILRGSAGGTSSAGSTAPTAPIAPVAPVAPVAQLPINPQVQ
jgi:pilus assembly protein CpaB